MAAAFNLSSATAKFSHTSDRGAVLGHGIRNCTVSVTSMDSSAVWPCRRPCTHTHTHMAHPTTLTSWSELDSMFLLRSASAHTDLRLRRECRNCRVRVRTVPLPPLLCALSRCKTACSFGGLGIYKWPSPDMKDSLSSPPPHRCSELLPSVLSAFSHPPPVQSKAL